MDGQYWYVMLGRIGQSDSSIKCCPASSMCCCIPKYKIPPALPPRQPLRMKPIPGKDLRVVGMLWRGNLHRWQLGARRSSAGLQSPARGSHASHRHHGCPRDPPTSGRCSPARQACACTRKCATVPIQITPLALLQCEGVELLQA